MFDESVACCVDKMIMFYIDVACRVNDDDDVQVLRTKKINGVLAYDDAVNGMMMLAVNVSKT